MDFIPDSLTALTMYPQFIIYELYPHKDKPGKNEKIPIDYRTKRAANPLDPAAWLSAEQALTVKKLHTSRYGHGIGFVLTDRDPFFFLDIDNCWVNGSWSELAVSLCNVFHGAAIEVSTSQKGLHIIGIGKPPCHSCVSTITGGLELYHTNRFVALTGMQASGNAAMDCSDKLPWLVDTYFKSSSNSSGNWFTDWEQLRQQGKHPNWCGPENDNELINRALRCVSAKAIFGGGATFKDLWEANYEVLQRVYQGNESSYDAALAQHLAYWTGNDCDRIYQLMLRSKLVREKWSRDDYLPRTITQACLNQTEFLKDTPPQSTSVTNASANTNKATPIVGNTFLTPEQQLTYFAGCTYVRELHKILIPGGYLLKPDQFRATYGGRNFLMDSLNQRVSRNAWEAFTECQTFDQPRADTICFRPQEAAGIIIEEDDCKLANVWWPVNTRRLAGDVSPFLTHVKKLLDDERDQEILLSYLAACLQYKGIKFQWAPFIQGVEGNGKTLLTRCVRFALGKRYYHSPKAAEITAKFNDWMYCKILIGVEDIRVLEQQLEVLEALKPMITGEIQEIEPKGLAKFSAEICCNFILNSNHKEGIRKTENNRIFAPFYTRQQTKEDLKRDGMDNAYFRNLYNWLRKEGYAIVSEYLHTFSIPDEFNPATECMRAPDTSTTYDAIKHGMGSIEQEILEAIDQGLIGFRGGWISSVFLSQLLDRIQAARRIPRNKRRDLLHALGYVWHPSLNNGRVNNIVLPDAGKPQLFIKIGHPALEIREPSEISRLYSEAQTKESY